MSWEAERGFGNLFQRLNSGVYAARYSVHPTYPGYTTAGTVRPCMLHARTTRVRVVRVGRLGSNPGITLGEREDTSE